MAGRSCRYLAVTLVLGLRGIVLSLLCYVSRRLITSFSLYSLAFWLTSFATLAFYLKCSLGSPGEQCACPSRHLLPAEQERAPTVGRRWVADERRLKELSKQTRKRPSFRIESSSSSSDYAVGDCGLEEDSDDGSEGLNVVDLGCAADDVQGGVPLTLTDSVSVDIRPGASASTETAATLQSAESTIGRRAENEVQLQRAPSKGFEMCNSPDSSKLRRLRRLGYCIAWSKTYAVVVLTGSVVGCVWGIRQLLASAALVLRPWGDLFHYKEVSTPTGTTLDGLFKLGTSAMYQGQERLTYCEKCNQWRLLRTKHCRSCGICVRQYDHHCPWLGQCVGERNRLHFCWYLLLQTVELAWVIGEAFYATLLVDPKWIEETQPSPGVLMPRLGLLVLVVLLICLLMMTFGLYFYHVFLTLTNLTTWETLAWDSITYLKHRDKLLGSPFTAPTGMRNLSLLSLPCLLNRGKVARALAVAGRPQSTCRVGPNGELLWIANSSGTGFEQAPMPALEAPCTNFLCCNIYEYCV